MSKFQDFKYERPDFEKIEKDLEILLRDFNDSQSLKEENNLFIKINQIRSHVSTMVKLCFIRHSIDTRDEFYSREQDFLDEKLPRYMEIESLFYQAILNSKYRDELENIWGRQIFNIAEMKVKTYSRDIISELIEENKLINKYSKLIASANIYFKGAYRTLSEMLAFMESEDENIRQESSLIYDRFFEENEDEFDDIYDKLVRVRTKMAKKLGFDNFIDLGYLRMGRFDYGKEEIKSFRKEVLDEIVPLVEELKDQQRENLGLDKLYYYDESLKFKTGNPVPRGDFKFILTKAREMYGSLSKETREFFDYILNKCLLDIMSKPGKMSGGYCEYIDDFNSPFIFANFNKTMADINVLTHEIGHAFQTYMSKDLELLEYSFPTSEAAEIHSMSMEFITYPWMELFFAEDLDKYKYIHLSSALSFIPYGVLVDEFQHEVYANPELTKEERKKKWRDLERKYLPFREYKNSDLLNRGGFWYRQGHIFELPFYYIDYTIAQVCAFQFLIKLNSNRELAWKDYINMCKVGGSRSFLEILEIANLKNPLDEGTVREVSLPIKDYLETIDISKY